MADSVYRVTEVVGVSSDSWEARLALRLRLPRRACASNASPRSFAKT
jgi:hypothetical protein